MNVGWKYFKLWEEQLPEQSLHFHKISLHLGYTHQIAEQVYCRTENMKHLFSPTVNPTKALVSPVSAGNVALGVGLSVTLRDDCFHQDSPLL